MDKVLTSWSVNSPKWSLFSRSFRFLRSWSLHTDEAGPGCSVHSASSPAGPQPSPDSWWGPTLTHPDRWRAQLKWTWTSVGRSVARGWAIWLVVEADRKASQPSDGKEDPSEVFRRRCSSATEHWSLNDKISHCTNLFPRRSTGGFPQPLKRMILGYTWYSSWYLIWVYLGFIWVYGEFNYGIPSGNLT